MTLTRSDFRFSDTGNLLQDNDSTSLTVDLSDKYMFETKKLHAKSLKIIRYQKQQMCLKNHIFNS